MQKKWNFPFIYLYILALVIAFKFKFFQLWVLAWFKITYLSVCTAFTLLVIVIPIFPALQ